MNRPVIKQLLRNSCVLLMLAGTTAAQSSTVITGKVAGRPVQKVSLTYWYDPGISPAVTQDTLLKPDSFYFRIPLPVGKEIFFYADAGSGSDFYGMIRGGDSLQLMMQGDSTRFGGSGAGLNRAIYEARRAQLRVTIPASSDALQLAAAYRRQLQAGNGVMALYRDSLSPATWAVARAHVLGEAASGLVGTLWKVAAAPDSTLEERQVLFYKENILPVLPQALLPDTTVTPIRYLGYLLHKAEADYFIQHRYECNNRAIYEWLKTHYSGRLRDRLLAHSLTLGFAAGNPAEEQEWCVRDYLEIVQDAACKQAIAKLYGRSRKGISKGVMAPVFSFPDAQGKLVSLRQFSGKVVLLHFYSGSAPVLPALTEIKDCFNNAVAFVNICCDGAAVKDLPGWIWQLDDQHREVLTQYSISKYPSFIVVGKNGKVYATRPPDPAVDKGTALANIIYEALLQ